MTIELIKILLQCKQNEMQVIPKQGRFIILIIINHISNWLISWIWHATKFSYGKLWPGSDDLLTLLYYDGSAVF